MNTKLPWVFKPYGGRGHGGLIESAEGDHLADVYIDDSPNYANGNFIVRACNSHDALVQALQGLFEHCAMVHKHWGEGSNAKEADDAIVFARAALAKAEA